ncbi:MAG: transcriptional regulator [Nitrososphaerales archaeon]
MEKDQITGTVILIASILGIIIYGWLLFFTTWTTMVLQISFFIAVVAILVILSWIGWTKATVLTPKPREPKASTELEQLKERG